MHLRVLLLLGVSAAESPYVYHGCITEDVGEESSLFCVHSLAPRDHTPGSPRHPNAGPTNTFPSRDAAATECMTRGYDGLLDVTTVERNKLAAQIVDSLGVPHWLGGDDSPNGVVTWSDRTEHSEQLFVTPWHKLSAQPNDCDGPGSETCMFMGPGGAWFDFACRPKTRNVEIGITAGPEIGWVTGAGEVREKMEYSIWPLCGGNVLDEEEGTPAVLSRKARRLVEGAAASREM